MTAAALTLVLVHALAGLVASQIPTDILPEKPDPGVTAPEGVLQGGDKIENAEPHEMLWGAYEEPGHYEFVISIDGWLGVPFGSAYVAAIRNYDLCAVEEMSWGTIKAMYR